MKFVIACVSVAAGLLPGGAHAQTPAPPQIRPLDLAYAQADAECKQVWARKPIRARAHRRQVRPRKPQAS